MLPGLSPEMQLLCLLGRPRLSARGHEQALLLARQRIDWPRLVQHASFHGVTAFVQRQVESVLADEAPAQIRRDMRAYAHADALKAECMADELVRVLTALGQAGVCAVPFKGPVLAQRLWGDERMGCYNDLDLILHPADFRRAAACLMQLGYKLENARLDELMTQRNWSRMLYLGRTHEMGFWLRLDMQPLYLPNWCGWPARARGAWSQLVTARFRGIEFPSLSDDWYLLFLGIHTITHMFSRLYWVAGFQDLLDACPAIWPKALALAKKVGAGHELQLAKRACAAILDEALAPRGADTPILLQLAEAPYRDDSGITIDFLLAFRLRPGLQAKASYALSVLVAPRPSDLAALPLPRILAPGRLILRPVRLVLRYLVGPLWRHAQAFLRLRRAPQPCEIQTLPRDDRIESS